MRLIIALLSSGAATALSATTARPSASARTNLLQVLADVVPNDRFSAPPAGAKRLAEAVAALESAIETAATEGIDELVLSAARRRLREAEGKVRQAEIPNPVPPTYYPLPLMSTDPSLR